MPRLAALALFGSLALVASGCGGKSKEDAFKDDFKPLNAQILDIGNDVGSGIRNARTKSDVQLKGQFGSFAERLRRVQRELGGLDPPDKLKSDKERLVAALGAATRDLRGIETAASRHDAAAAGQATRRLILDSPRLRATRRALAKATGAKLGP